MPYCKSITSLSTYGGYDPSGDYTTNKIYWATNSITVPDSSFSGVTYDLLFKAYYANGSLFTKSIGDSTRIYFSTSTSGLGYGSNSVVNYSNLSSYKGKTIYLFGLLSLVDFNYSALTNQSVTGTITFYTDTDNHKIHINVYPQHLSPAIYFKYPSTEFGTTFIAITTLRNGGSIVVPRGSIAWKIVLSGYVSQYGKITHSSNSNEDTINIFLRATGDSLRLEEGIPSDLYVGDRNITAIAQGDKIVYARKKEETTSGYYTDPASYDDSR